MRNKTIIEIKALPNRARKLEPAELVNVFGGCKGPGRLCFLDSDCCHEDCVEYTKQQSSSSYGGYHSLYSVRETTKHACETPSHMGWTVND